MFERYDFYSHYVDVIFIISSKTRITGILFLFIFLFTTLGFRIFGLTFRFIIQFLGHYLYLQRSIPGVTNLLGAIFPGLVSSDNNYTFSSHWLDFPEFIFPTLAFTSLAFIFNYNNAAVRKDQDYKSQVTVERSWNRKVML